METVVALRNPQDPFLADALGAERFARETMKLARKKSLDLDAAIYWAARCAFHWIQKSNGWSALVCLALFASGCSSMSAPTPVATTTTTTSIPVIAAAPLVNGPVLLAGQSNAVLLRDLVWPRCVNVVQGGTGIEAWESLQPLGRELLEDARGSFGVFVWWQGEHDSALTSADYAVRLRRIIADVRSHSGSSLAVRIVQIRPLSDLDGIRAALASVASDPNNALIPTDDLAFDVEAPAHLAAASYPIVASRILR